MTDQLRNDTPSAWGHVDVVCDEFERLWRQGQPRQVEDFLDQVCDSEQHILVHELVLLEASFHCKQGTEPPWESYEARLPQFTDAIRNARDRFMANSLTGTADDSNATSPAASMDSVEPPLGSLPSRCGHFELRQVIGRGAFGTVYRARDTRLNRDVALKIPRAGIIVDADDSARFVREARAAGQLQHPSIITVYEAGEFNGTIYIASEFIEGTTLRDALIDGYRPTYRQAAVLVRDLALAVNTAHAHGIIHRDLKPANILLDSDRHPHIADFGLARELATDSELTLEGTRLGTPAYMSPEQVHGRSHLADARSDLWGLGVILYELLAGRRPFVGSSETVFSAICSDDPVSPRLLRRTVPRDLATICLKCLEKNPDARYPTAQHLADDLNRWLHNSPITARPVSSWERGTKWARRNPVLFGVAALAMMAVVGAFAYLQTRPAYFDLRIIPELAAVTVDGQPITVVGGRALLTSWPGRHTLAIEADGFLPMRQDVVLSRGAENTVVLSARLVSGYGYLRADSKPSGATVEVRRGGEIVSRGLTPFHSERMRAGPYELTLAKDLYRAAVVAIDVPTGERVTTAQLQTLVPAAKNHESYQEILSYRDWLEQNVEVPVGTLPLKQFVRSLSERTKSLLVLDVDSLKELGVKPDIPVKARVSQKTAKLREVLSSVLGPLGLAWRPTTSMHEARPVIVVTSKAKADKVLMTVLYPVGELLEHNPQISARQTANAISGTVYPATWDGVGGSGSIGYDEALSALYVSQTFDMHLAVVSALESLRARNVLGHPRENITKGDQEYVLRAHQAIVWSIGLAPDGRRLVSSSGGMVRGDEWLQAGFDGVPDNSIRVWDAESWRTKASGAGHSHYVKCAVFSADGQSIFTASADGSIREWNATTGQQIRMFEGTTGWLNSIAVSADGRQLLSGGADGKVRLWEVATGKQLKEFEGHSKPVLQIVFFPGEPHIASVSEDESLRIWDANDGRELHRCDVPKSSLVCIDVSADGKRVIVGGSAGITLWSVSGDPHQEGAWQLFAAVRAVKLIPDSRHALVGCEHSVLLVDTDTGTILHSFVGHLGLIQALAVLPPGDRFASGGRDGTLRVWRIPEATPIAP